jgi:hypothetical protein
MSDSLPDGKVNTPKDSVIFKPLATRSDTLIVELNGRWNPKMFIEAAEDENIKANMHNVKHLIVDLSRQQAVPAGVLGLSASQFVKQEIFNKNIIVAGADVMSKAMIDIIVKIGRVRTIKTAQTLEQGVSLLEA